MAATAVPLRSRRAARRRQLLRVNDERLVARVRAGDDDAFEAIYDRYYLSLLAFCRHMLGSRHEAEDALQHSFASAYSALRGGDGVDDLRPWLYTIARNRCLSALRAQREELCADELELGSRAFDGLAGEIQLRSDLRDLVDDLQRLPEDQRAALVLFELGDQSHEQIAGVLGVRREKVKALVFQAREALLRARRARDEPCADVRERVATGDVPRRSVLRGHIDRCPNCAAFEQEVRGQRAAFAAIMPVAPTVGLKASILAALGCGSAAAVGGTGATVVGTGATVAGSVAAGGTTIGLASLGAKGVVTKALAVVALAGGTTDAHVAAQRAPAHKAPATQHVARTAAAGGAAAAAVRARASHGRRAAATLLHGSKPKHHASATHAAPAPAKAPPPAAAAPEAVHAPPTPTPAATPQAVQQTTAPAPSSAEGPAATSPQQQPATAPAPQTAPSAPAAQPDTSSSSTPAPAPASTPQPSAAPDTAAPASSAPDAAPSQTSAAASPTVAPDATT
jgi:RNA polymerase sigma factor (sigma-70 family)